MEVYEFMKSASQKIVIQLNECSGSQLIDIRVFYKADIAKKISDLQR